MASRARHCSTVPLNRERSKSSISGGVCSYIYTLIKISTEYHVLNLETIWKFSTLLSKWKLRLQFYYFTLTLSLFSCSVVSDSLWPHGRQHARPPCPSPSPETCANVCPLSQWYHPTISSSVIPFYSCLLSFPASGSFPLSQFFASDGQSNGTSTSIGPSNEHSWLVSFSIDWFELLVVPGTLKNLL